MKSGCATALVLNKWDLTGGEGDPLGPGGGVGAAELDRERARVNRKLRLRPRVLTASRDDRPQRPAAAARGAVARPSAPRTASRRPSSTASSAEVVAARQPPAKQGHRLKLLYMAQIGTRPPRFAIQVNNRNELTRDYAYFVENRLRERYALEGIPLIIDFVERKQRAAGLRAAQRRRRSPLAALGPVDAPRRGSALLLAARGRRARSLAGLLVGGDDAATPAAPQRSRRPDARARATARGDDLATTVWELARRFPSLRALHARRSAARRPASATCGRGSATSSPLALPAAGGDPLAARRRRRPRRPRERLPARGCRRPPRRAFAGDFLVIGPSAEVTAAIDARGGDGAPRWPTTRVYRRAAELERAPVELYAPAAGLRRAAGGARRRAARGRRLRRGAALRGRRRAACAPEERRRARHAPACCARPGAPPAPEFAPALAGPRAGERRRLPRRCRAPTRSRRCSSAAAPAALLARSRAALPDARRARPRPRRARPARRRGRR